MLENQKYTPFIFLLNCLSEMQKEIILKSVAFLVTGWIATKNRDGEHWFYVDNIKGERAAIEL